MINIEGDAISGASQFRTDKKIPCNYERFNPERAWKLLWCAAFILQFFLFRSYCYREILNCIPEKMDQVGYINVSYKVYDHILKNGLLQGFIFGINNSLNSGMTLVGAVSLFIFGFTRFSLLLPNFFACFLCEYTVASVLDRIYKNKFLSLIFCGLFLMTTAVFAAVGGIFDYRWDFMAFCVYTIWLAYLLEYLCSNSPRAFYCSAVAGGILLCVRLNTILYLGGVLFVISVVRLIRGPKIKKECIKLCIKYASFILFAGGWYLVINFKNFFKEQIEVNSSEGRLINIPGWKQGHRIFLVN